MEEDLKTRLNLLKNNLIKHFNSNYPNKLLCLEQAYSFTYTLTYGIKDGDKFNGETVTETIVNEGIIYYTFEEPKIKKTLKKTAVVFICVMFKLNILC